METYFHGDFRAINKVHLILDIVKWPLNVLDDLLNTLFDAIRSSCLINVQISLTVFPTGAEPLTYQTGDDPAA